MAYNKIKQEYRYKNLGNDYFPGDDERKRV